MTEEERQEHVSYIAEAMIDDRHQVLVDEYFDLHPTYIGGIKQ